MKKALITGIYGQDAYFLTKLLLEKDYKIYGISNSLKSNQLDSGVEILNIDITHHQKIEEIINSLRPDEIYNLAAMSRPSESWSKKNIAIEVNGLGAVNIFEACKNHSPKTKIFQASSSEMYGSASDRPIDESSNFQPLSPYAASKLFAHHMAKIYRNSYGMYIVCGILFNHESKLRPLNYLIPKIVYAAACLHNNIYTSSHLNEIGMPIFNNGKLMLGNKNITRDWGHAKDYVQAMYLMMSQKNPTDYIIGSGKHYSIEEICQITFNLIKRDYRDYVVFNEALLRPSDANVICANPKKIESEINWKSSTGMEEIIKEMLHEFNNTYF
jgi:GDPmannose 4,6-dehydratase